MYGTIKMCIVKVAFTVNESERESDIALKLSVRNLIYLYGMAVVVFAFDEFGCTSSQYIQSNSRFRSVSVHFSKYIFTLHENEHSKYLLPGKTVTSPTEDAVSSTTSDGPAQKTTTTSAPPGGAGLFGKPAVTSAPSVFGTSTGGSASGFSFTLPNSSSSSKY